MEKKLKNQNAVLSTFYVLLIIGALAFLSWKLAALTQNLVGAGVIALTIGMALHPLMRKAPYLKPGLDFASTKLLKLGIILTGVTMQLTRVIGIGVKALIVVACVFALVFGVGFLLRRLFNLDWKLTSLLSVGASICGGTAIAAVAPAIDADDSDVAYSVSLTFIFDMVLVLVLPFLGRLAGLPDTGFGLWIGTAISDTSSVVAAGYAYSDAAGAVAVIVKLTRTLLIVPMVVVFSVIAAKRRKHTPESDTQTRAGRSVWTTFPWFIVGFVAIAAANTLIPLPSAITGSVEQASKWIMVMALGAIGCKTDIKLFVAKGTRPLAFKGILAALMVAATYILQSIL